MLKIHMDEKHNMSYNCEVCDRSFNLKRSLTVHMRVHTAQQHKHKEAILCEICGKSFNKYMSLKTHMRVHTGEKPYTCEVCGCAFSQRPHLRAHMTRHSNDRPFMCDACGKCFKTHNALQEHKRTHRQHTHARQHSCTTCSEQFVSVEKLENHLKCVHGSMKKLRHYECKNCERLFTTEATLNSHIITCPSEMLFSCDICQKKFPWQSMLVVHKRVHLDRPDRRCEVCGEAFENEQQFEKHIKLHPSYKAFKCTICDKAFKFKLLLLPHYRVHFDEKPYACTFCSKSFKQSPHLVTHLRLHNNEKPFSCFVCGKAFRDKGNLSCHVKLHDTDRQFKCSICPKGFVVKRDLQRHYSQCHPETSLQNVASLTQISKPDKSLGHEASQETSVIYFDKTSKIQMSATQFLASTCINSNTKQVKSGSSNDNTYTVVERADIKLHSSALHADNNELDAQWCNDSSTSTDATDSDMEPRYKNFLSLPISEADGTAFAVQVTGKPESPSDLLKMSNITGLQIIGNLAKDHHDDDDDDTNSIDASEESCSTNNAHTSCVKRKPDQPDIIWCVECCKHFSLSSIQDMEEHSHIHKDSLRFMCGICCQCFSNMSSLTLHKLIHKDMNPLCSICGRRFSTQSNLLRHMRSEHATVLTRMCSVRHVTGRNILSVPDVEKKSPGRPRKTEAICHLIQLKSVADSINVSSGNCDTYIARVGEHVLNNGTDTKLNRESMTISNQQSTCISACTGTSNKTNTCNASFVEKSSDKERQTSLLALSALEGMEYAGHGTEPIIPCNDDPAQGEVGQSCVLGNVDSGFALLIETSRLLEHGAGDSHRVTHFKPQSSISANSTHDCANNITLNANDWTQNTDDNQSSFISSLDANYEFFLPVDEISGKSAASCPSKPVIVTLPYQANGRKTLSNDSTYNDEKIHNTMTLTYTDVMTDADKLSHPGDELSDNQLSPQPKPAIVLIDPDAKLSSSSTAELSPGGHVNCDEAEDSTTPLQEQTKPVTDDIIVCVECDEHFSHASGAHQHMSLHAAGIRFVCGICGNSFSKSQQLTWHKRQHDKGRKQSCSCTVCGQTLKRSSELKIHMRTHSGERPYVCGVCHKRFIQRAHLNTHMLTHTGERKHLCATCGKSFALADGLRKHEDTVHRVYCSSEQARPHGRFLCDLCSKVFTSIVSLRGHKQRIHSENGKPRRQYNIQSSERMQQLFPCGVCSKSYTTLSAKELHRQQIHLQEYTLQCSVCLQYFPSKSKLDNHLVQVHKKKPFKCHLCQKSFLFMQTLKTHLMSHTGEKPFPCLVCNKTFRQQHHLKTHMLMHTGERPYACETCGKRFSNISNQRNHERTHLAIRPYACSLCSRTYAVKRDLVRHQQANHSC